jgi:D-glycero-alpha-D-manno-heptose 1-phosphate guanylyltransferase
VEAIILAGGLGTRLRSAVPNLPKPMAPINGKPFLEYLLDYWLQQGIKRFILSVGYKGEVIREQFGTKYKDVDLNYAIEKEPLGTGGGLLLSIKQLKSQKPFLLLNGDTFFAVNLKNLFKHHNDCNSDITLSLVKIPNNKRYSAILLNKYGLINSIERRIESSKEDLSNGGVYVMKKNLFEECKLTSKKKCSLENNLIPDLLSQKRRVSGFVSSAKFIDIGVPSDYNRAEKILT